MVELWAEQLRNWSWDLEPVVEAAGGMEDQPVSEKEEQAASVHPQKVQILEGRLNVYC